MSKSEDPLYDSISVVKTATCDTLTKKSRLTYQIGTLLDGEVYLRVHRNTGNGFFSNEWISLQDIRKTLTKLPFGKPVTAFVLDPLFKGRSVNSAGFLLGILVHEKLLVPVLCLFPNRLHNRIVTICASAAARPTLESFRSVPHSRTPLGSAVAGKKLLLPKYWLHSRVRLTDNANGMITLRRSGIMTGPPPHE